jgi:hypothetical protein
MDMMYIYHNRGSYGDACLFDGSGNRRELKLCSLNPDHGGMDKEELAPTYQISQART